MLSSVVLKQSEAAMDDSHFPPNQNGERRVDNGGGDDRISELPNEVLHIILSYLPLRTAASTTVLSPRWSDLWRLVPNLESDRMSPLPDQVISTILSFLPLKAAAATCVLSSRWLNSWKHTPNLVLDRGILPVPGPTYPIAEVQKFVEIVSSVLQSYRAPSLNQLRICFNVSHSETWAVTKWIEFVFSREVENLEINFGCHGWDEVVLGESLSTINGDRILFRSLKSLHLSTIEVSGGYIEIFLQNCPLLELLSIHFLCLTSDLEASSPSLKRLDVTRCRGRRSVKVSAPKLTSIRFCNEEGMLLFENVPMLVEADLEINTSEAVIHHFASAASSHISRLEFLHIRLPRPTAFWTNAFPRMPNLKKLIIACLEVYSHSLVPPVTRVIWASPRLEEFTLQLSGDRGRRDHETAAYLLEIANVAGRSPHRHLKVFNLNSPYGQNVDDHVVDLVTYVLNNCVALRRIDISCRHMTGDLRLFLQSRVPDHVQLTIEGN